MVNKVLIFCFIFFSNAFFAFSQCDDLEVEAGPDKKFCPSEKLILDGAFVSGNYVRTIWYPIDQVLDPQSLYTEVVSTGTYTLTASAWDYETNLLENGDFSLGNTGFASDYEYVPPVGPFDNSGMYGVDLFPADYSPTGPGTYRNCSPLVGDKMFIARGTNLPGARVWRKNLTVEPYTDYHFVFYSANIGVSHSAQFTVYFNNSPVPGFNNAGFNCEWTRHEAYWYSGINTSLEIGIVNIHRNLPYKTYANAFVMDNMQLYKTCKKEDEVTIERIPMPIEADDPDKAYCENYTQILTLKDYPVGEDYSVRWSTTDGNILDTDEEPPFSALVEGPGEYIAELIYDDGEYTCLEWVDFQVVGEFVNFKAYPEEVIELSCQSQTAELTAFDTNSDFEYIWYTEDGQIEGDSSGTNIQVSQQGIYYLIETDPVSGCGDTSLIEIFSNEDIPEAIIDGEGMFNCNNTDEIQLIGQRSYIGEDDVFSWSTPDGNFSSSTDQLNVDINEAGTYFLIVTDSITGCSDTATVDILSDLSTPLVSIPDSVILDCSNWNDPVIFNSRVNEPDVNTQWRTPNNNTLDQDTIAVSDEGMYILTVFDSSSYCLIQDTFHLINNREIPELSINPAEELNCRNARIEIQAEIDQSLNLTSSWQTTNGNISSPNSSPIIQVDQPGWYTFTVINQETRCLNTDSILIMENYELPSIESLDSLILTCDVQQIELQGNTDFTFNGLEWEWRTYDGNILNDRGHIVEVNASGHYFFWIHNTNNGCQDSLPQIVVPDENIPSLEVSEPELLTCTRQSVNISAQGTSTSGSQILYSWSTNNGQIDGDPYSGSITVSEPGIYILQVTDQANGCRNNTSVEVEIDTISPQAPLEVMEKLNCNIQSIRLFPNTAEQAHYIYLWSTTNGEINSDPNLYEIEVISGGTYFLEVTNVLNGCTNRSQVEVVEDIDLPLISLATPDQISCNQSEVEISSYGSSNGPNFNYSWSTTDGNILSQSDSSLILVNEPGRYTLTVQNTDNNCENSRSTVVEDNRIHPEINITDPDQLACYRETTKIEATVSQIGNSTDMIWSTTNGNILTDINGTSIDVDQEGTYYFQVQNLNNGCFTKDSILVTRDPEEPREFTLDTYQANCPDEVSNISILSISGGYGPYTILLNNQQIDILESIELGPGDYDLLIRDINDCGINHSFSIEPVTSVEVERMEDVTIEIGESYELNPVLNFGISQIESIDWSPSSLVSCSTCLNARFIGSSSSVLELNIRTINGCETSARVNINVILNKNIYAPNAFSPNEDGANDYFTIYVKDQSVAQINYLRIFNRWGDKVFDKENFPANVNSEGWDGTHVGEPLNPAVFVFTAEVEFIDGSTKKISGDVSLIK
jgi:gliding motility-associated-like protein